MRKPESQSVYYQENLEAMNGLVPYLTETCCTASGACDPAYALKPKPVTIARVPTPKRRKAS